MSSPYLLSGLLRCGGCGAAYMGQGAKSGQFHHYVCATASRMGKEACGMRPVPQAFIEEQVLERVLQVILHEEHLEELVLRLTNQELEASLGHLKERMGALEGQLGEVDRRLGRLYDALETGQLELDDLAPRIRELREKRDLLLWAMAEAQETVAAGRVDLVNADMVLGYLKDLQGVLDCGAVGEQRAVLRSFIQSVERYPSEVTIHYTLPLPPDHLVTDPLGVLAFVPLGGPTCTVLRTFRWEVAL